MREVNLIPKKRVGVLVLKVSLIIIIIKTIIMIVIIIVIVVVSIVKFGQMHPKMHSNFSRNSTDQFLV